MAKPPFRLLRFCGVTPVVNHNRNFEMHNSSVCDVYGVVYDVLNVYNFRESTQIG